VAAPRRLTPCPRGAYPDGGTGEYTRVMPALDGALRPLCSFVPPYLLARLAEDGDVAPPARATLDLDARLRSQRESRAAVPDIAQPTPGVPPSG
jgi:hypothetical protein